jgi:hypothetical protein
MDFNTSVPTQPVNYNITPVQVQNPMEMAAGIQQARLRNEQIKASQMENQQREIDLRDNELMRQSQMQSGGDLDKMLELFQKSGGSPKAAIALSQQVNSMKLAKANLNEKDLANHAAQNDQIEALLQPVLAESDPAKQSALWGEAINKAVSSGLMTPQEAQQHPYTGADGVKQYATGLETEKWLNAQAQKERSAAATAQAGTAAKREEREGGQQDFMSAVSALSATPPKDAQEYRQRVGQLKPAVAQRMLAELPPDQYDPSTIRKLGMTPDQQAQTENASATLAETIKRDAASQQHAITDESLRKIQLGIEQGRLKQEQLVNGMKYGPGTAEYWVKQLQDNPDSIKEMPAELRSTVGQGFSQATGLPLPTPLSANGQTSETAARNALDGIAAIRDALQNPEVQKRLGPILGRLGEVEQDAGSTVGMSPAGAKAAQELRTRMRYFVMQEGKAILGGRLPQNLMNEMSKSSANVAMDAPTLAGAMQGAEDNAKSILDNNDKQRFGGKMRSREQRGLGATPAAAPQKSYQKTMTGPNGHKIGWNPGDATWTDIQTGQPVK